MEEKDQDLEKAITEQMQKLQNDSIIIGAQTMCQVILDKIFVFNNTEGKRTVNDYKRFIKGIEKFCKVGISNKNKKEKDD